MSNPVTDRIGRQGPATTTTAFRAMAGTARGLPHDEAVEEPYRPELVARLERAVRLGRYRPDAHVVADALLTAIDALD